MTEATRSKSKTTPGDGRSARVAIIGTGGSISFVGRDPLDLLEYGEFGHMLEVEELLTRLPELSSEAEIVPVAFGNYPSEAILPENWLDLARLVGHIAEQHAPLDGIVILHGTSTLEEGAFFLNLLLRHELTVVMAGAQGPINGLGNDGRLNIVNAVRVAKSLETRGLGVLVVHGNEIHAARDVTKISTHSISPFASRDLGILGYVDPNGWISIYRRPTRRHTVQTDFDPRRIHRLPRVDVVCAYAGADDAAIEGFLRRDAKGIVVSGYSPGSAAMPQDAALDEARRKGVLIVLSAHVGHGRVLPRRSLIDRRIVVADTLGPLKARLLAMLALNVTDEIEAIQRYFDTC
jgi:L-asparaginase